MLDTVALHDPGELRQACRVGVKLQLRAGVAADFHAIYRGNARRIETLPHVQLVKKTRTAGTDGVNARIPFRRG